MWAGRTLPIPVLLYACETVHEKTVKQDFSLNVLDNMFIPRTYITQIESSDMPRSGRPTPHEAASYITYVPILRPYSCARAMQHCFTSSRRHPPGHEEQDKEQDEEGTARHSTKFCTHVAHDLGIYVEFKFVLGDAHLRHGESTMPPVGIAPTPTKTSKIEMVLNMLKYVDMLLLPTQRFRI